jgi:hypothetical protein
MNPEFPYQLTAFLDTEPAIGESVYYGENGWYPQIALKRRFKTVGITEDELLAKLTEYCGSKEPFGIQTGDLIQPERMPVKVIEVQSAPELLAFHHDFITFMGDAILSRYPERDGANYLPHMTAEYNGEMVIDVDKFTNKSFTIDSIFLLKDVNDENSIAYRHFEL